MSTETRAFIRGNEKWKYIATLGFHIHKIWQILKCFAGTFRQAQILNLGGVSANLFLRIFGSR